MASNTNGFENENIAFGNGGNSFKKKKGLTLKTGKTFQSKKKYLLKTDIFK